MNEEDRTPLHPSTWRVVAAFLLAPGFAVLLLAIFMPAYAGLDSYFERVWRTALTFAIVGAYPMTLLVGVPAFVLLRYRVRPTATICSLTGAGVAGLPWLLIVTLLLPDSASIDGRPTVIDGSLTAHGWLTNLIFVGQLASCGLIGGFLFWLIAAGGSRTDKVG